MNNGVFDYLTEYIDYMLPQAREQLAATGVYQEYRLEKQRLSAIVIAAFEQGAPLTSSDFIADIRALESLGMQVLELAKRLDPYED